MGEDQPSIRHIHHRRSISDDATPDVKFTLYDSVYCDDVMTVSANRTSLCLHSRVFEKMLIDPLHQSTGRVKLYDANIKHWALTFCIRNIYVESSHKDTPDDITTRIQRLNDALGGRPHESIYQQLSDDVTSGECLYVSRVFLLEGLCRISMDHLTRSLRVENVSWIYSLAYSLDMNELKEICFDYMSEESEDLLVSPTLLDLSKEALLEIIDRDDFLADEVMVFDAATRWAVHSRDQLTLADMTSRNVRTIRQTLGWRGLYSIRFAVIPRDIFESRVEPLGILTVDELNCKEDLFKTKERSIEIVFDPVKRVLPEFRLQRWNESDTILFDSSVGLKLHSLKTLGLKDKIVEIVTFRISKTKSQITLPRQCLKPDTHWSLDDQQEMHFNEPVFLPSKFINCLIIKTDPATVYTCMSGSTTRKIRGVTMTATYYTNSFVSAVLSPASYLPPSYSDSSSSESSLGSSPHPSLNQPTSTIRQNWPACYQS